MPEAATAVQPDAPCMPAGPPGEDALELELLRAAVLADMKRFYDGYPSTAHPMAILSSMVVSLSSFYPEAIDVANKETIIFKPSDQLIVETRTNAAPRPKRPRCGRTGAASSSAAHSSRVNDFGSRSFGMRAFFVPSVMYGP